MGRLAVFFCLVCVSAAADIDPRGARPVEQGTRADKCATQREWPLCTSDEWGLKCPSGCRIQGLMDKYDHGVLKGIEKIRKLLDQNSNKHRSADSVSKETYNYIREQLVLDSGSNNNYHDLAQSLRQKITDMKIKIDSQMRVLGALKDQVKGQVQDMQRLEVDIDIKLRSCKGSCSKYSEHQVDQESYVTLDKQMQQLDSTQQLDTVASLSVMKSRPLQDVIVESHYRSKDVDGTKTSGTQHKVNDVFTDVKTVSLVLEEEGSSSSPATVSKVPGTSFSSSSSSSTSITELGGGAGGGGGDPFGAGGADPLFPPGGSSHVSTVDTSSCTRSVKRTVVHTISGPVEKVEEVMEGGPHCAIIPDTSKGDLSSLFPTLTHASKSTTKGSLLGDSKTGFGDPFGGVLFGGDLGGFNIDNTEDDIPNFKARSAMSSRVERQADYVGQDCVAAHHHHLKGETSGLFKVRPGGATVEVEVYCQQDGLMGGWLLVQQRAGGALDFNRTWAEYRDGFGSVDVGGNGELWLGNKHLHLLTNQGESLLRVELLDREGGSASAEYVVRVGSEDAGFPLHVSAYSGDAGDALAPHAGRKFSTYDRDNDRSGQNCAATHGAGWWYDSCQHANANANDKERGGGAAVWTTLEPKNKSVKRVRMFVRPSTF